jgi:DtxR family Mn-dependent transcriptional regulator
MDELTEFEEMYVKRIFEVHDHSPDAIVRTSQLAELMGVSSASVTEMIQRLAQRDFVTYIPYKGCRLTPSGFHKGASVKRRQLLLEIFLSSVLGITQNVTEISCRMEHAIDSVVESAIDSTLGYPSETADGRKIPMIGRNLEIQNSNPVVAIEDVSNGNTCEIVVLLCPPSELPALESVGVVPGAILQIGENGPILSNSAVLWGDDVRLLVRVI